MVVADNAQAYSCKLCVFFNHFYSLGQDFNRNLYTGLGPDAAMVLRIGLVTWLLLIATRMITTGAGTEQMKKMPLVLIAGVITSTMLNNYDEYMRWIYSPIQDTALSIAAYVLTSVQQAGASYQIDPTAGNGYAQLINIVEIKISNIIELFWYIITGVSPDQPLTGGAVVTSFILSPLRIIAGLVMMVPYLFVIGIFTAFLVEVAFKFIAITAVAPVLMMGVPFPVTRAYTVAALRILLGAGLTVVFAAAAMGLTVATVSPFADNIRAQLKGDQAWAENCNVWKTIIGNTPASCGEPYQTFSVFSPDFMVLFVLGFVSVLLHLQSKSLASNISGANDGAGPAAATVAAGKMILGGGLAASSMALMGSGGMRGAATRGIFGGVGRAAAEGGAMGMATAGAGQLLNKFRGGGETSGWNSRSPSYSGGGGGGGGFTTKQMQELSRGIGGAVEKGVGRALEKQEERNSNGRPRGGSRR